LDFTDMTLFAEAALDSSVKEFVRINAAVIHSLIFALFVFLFAVHGKGADRRVDLRLQSAR
jgi:hypothetical protein